MDGFKILLSSSPEALRAVNPHIAIEAEYGDIVVPGNLATFAHHGSRAGNPAPCVNDIIDQLGAPLAQVAQWTDKDIIIGLSHFDLDSLGGCIKVMGLINGVGSREFWALAAQADVSGPHTLDRKHPCYDQLAAFWAWSEVHRLYAPRDGSVMDATEKVQEAIAALRRCIGREAAEMEAGAAFMSQEEALNAASYCESAGGIIKRLSGQFVNHLYRNPRGEAQQAVVALNTSQGSVTISFAAPIPGVSAKEIVQGLWGPEAGGRDGIAGSPRNRRMTGIDLHAAFAAVGAALQQHPTGDEPARSGVAPRE
jgi:hypothetical protein